MCFKTRTPQHGSMQILISLRTLGALRRDIIGTPARIRIQHGGYTSRLCIVKNARRESLNHLKDAVSLWNSMGVDFSVSLGDLIDGQNSGTYGQGNAFLIWIVMKSVLSTRGPTPAQTVTPYQTSTTTQHNHNTRTCAKSPPRVHRCLHRIHITTGLSFEKPQTDTAFRRVWHLMKQCRSPVFHAIGNHELYNFKSAELRAQFNEDGQVAATPHSCHVRRNTASCFWRCDQIRKITAPSS